MQASTGARSIADGHPTGRSASGHFAELDFVRVIATLLVILLHSTSPVLYQIRVVPSDVWDTHNFIGSAARICVPLFFMTSGFLLMSQSAGSRTRQPVLEVGRRLLRIGLPLLAWSVFYAVSNAYLNGQLITISTIQSSVIQASQGATVYHLWFVYELAVLYILVPILRTLFDGGIKIASYFLLVWIMLALLRQLSALTDFTDWASSFIALNNSGYLVAGGLFRVLCTVPSRPITVAALVGYVLCTFGIVDLTARYSQAAGVLDEQFYTYSTFLVMMQSLSAFLILIKIGHITMSRWQQLRSITATIAKISFGVYFVHVFILERFGYNVFGSPSETSIEAMVTIFTTAIVVFLLSFLIATALSWMRFTRWLVT